MGYKYFSQFFMKLESLFDIIWQSNIQYKTTMPPRKSEVDHLVHFLLIMVFSFLP